MKISAIIAEYNPFHNGHAYHLEETRRRTQSDCIIVIMSGHFTQRGEPALIDKWTRSRRALEAGADLVLELPTLFATASAENFAFGAVSILHALGCVKTLSFGSEIEDHSLLDEAAQLFAFEPSAFQETLRAHLARGFSYPKARMSAAQEISEGRLSAELLSSPNAILAIEYIKWIKRLGSPICPYPILRKGAGYHDRDSQNAYPSALALREALKKEPNSAPIYLKEFGRPLPPLVFLDQLYPYVAYQLRTRTVDDLAKISEVSEGLEYKMKAASKIATDYQTLLDSLKSKRYPLSRLKRILLNLFLGVTWDLAHKAKELPLYARVLGVRKESVALLSLLSQQSNIPIITQPTGIDHPLLALDLLATDLYGLLGGFGAGRDHTEGLLLV